MRIKNLSFLMIASIMSQEALTMEQQDGQAHTYPSKRSYDTLGSNPLDRYDVLSSSGKEEDLSQERGTYWGQFAHSYSVFKERVNDLVFNPLSIQTVDIQLFEDLADRITQACNDENMVAEVIFDEFYDELIYTLATKKLDNIQSHPLQQVEFFAADQQRMFFIDLLQPRLNKKFKKSTIDPFNFFGKLRTQVQLDLTQLFTSQNLIKALKMPDKFEKDLVTKFRDFINIPMKTQLSLRSDYGFGRKLREKFQDFEFFNTSLTIEVTYETVTFIVNDYEGDKKSILSNMKKTLYTLALDEDLRAVLSLIVEDGLHQLLHMER